MTEQFNLVKQKTAALKTDIETLLKAFRYETGYTAEVKIETKTKHTNDGAKVQQTVSVTATVV